VTNGSINQSCILGETTIKALNTEAHPIVQFFQLVQIRINYDNVCHKHNASLSSVNILENYQM
jgi:hypothetical protein